ncbi:hypothetical protein [Bradyrhizobium sp. ORS 285]|uniref:hypothetical protein n=1 Tax=Bradyrhizobium sp. ORS 285 TaxID=115808 RepID=UPI0011124241|nr:hypothetical protein [Bradyrhizobium sp. ORS 285]
MRRRLQRSNESSLRSGGGEAVIAIFAAVSTAARRPIIFARSAMSLSLIFRSAPKGKWSDAPSECHPEIRSWPRAARGLQVRRHRRREPACRRRLSAGSVCCIKYLRRPLDIGQQRTARRGNISFEHCFKGREVACRAMSSIS